MQYLYACLFSNGHVKVGRSTDPASRIAAHEDRVSCLGIDLDQYRIYECAGYVVTAEARLIEECAKAAEQINKNEWFVGLSFEWACTVAKACAAIQYPFPQKDGLRSALAITGSLTAIAQTLDVSVQRLSNWLSRNAVPLEYCARLEKAADGAVMRWDMRPDDWHLIWPELRKHKDAPGAI